uniref:Uncharacterized protein n=1 Tax=Papilio xuthus TaxID=66420 RepID=I4DLM8_PAPXU|nr:unknown unsecreted protein [Papilio xuthus]
METETFIIVLTSEGGRWEQRMTSLWVFSFHCGCVICSEEYCCLCFSHRECEGRPMLPRVRGEGGGGGGDGDS